MQSSDPAEIAEYSTFGINCDGMISQPGGGVYFLSSYRKYFIKKCVSIKQITSLLTYFKKLRILEHSDFVFIKVL